MSLNRYLIAYTVGKGVKHHHLEYSAINAADAVRQFLANSERTYVQQVYLAVEWRTRGGDPS